MHLYLVGGVLWSYGFDGRYPVLDSCDDGADEIQHYGLLLLTKLILQAFTFFDIGSLRFLPALYKSADHHVGIHSVTCYCLARHEVRSYRKAYFARGEVCTTNARFLPEPLQHTYTRE